MREVAERIPEIERVVVVPYLRQSARDRRAFRGQCCGLIGAERRNGGTDGRLAAASAIALPLLPRFDFDHPIYILYSSGTTGLPKCMVHGAGGTLLQHLKELVLHTDLRREDRIFYFTTCGWMMWNWLVSSLAVGATVVLYDGAPLFRPRRCSGTWSTEEGVTVFGTSAKYLAMAEKEGLEPGPHPRPQLSSRAILSTGSPLAGHSYDYVYRRSSPTCTWPASAAAPTSSPASPWATPIGPVWRGELQTPRAGDGRARCSTREGRPVREQEGELVCTRPFPSMPVRFWDDPDGSKYQAAYFERYPGVWRHGDWARITEHDGLVILGRSDATLNPGGVRIGTAEIYRQVEQLPEVVESLVVGQEWEGDVRMVLFVRLREGLTLDQALVEPDPATDPGVREPPPRTPQDPAGGGHPPDHQREDHRAGGAGGHPRPPGGEPGCHGQSSGPGPVPGPGGTADLTSDRPAECDLGPIGIAELEVPYRDAAGKTQPHTPREMARGTWTMAKETLRRAGSLRSRSVTMRHLLILAAAAFLAVGCARNQGRRDRRRA